MHIEPTPTAKGYWIVNEDGAVYAFGDAPALGNVDAGALAPKERVTSLNSTPSGKGYWVFTTKGRVLTFGDAKPFGDLLKAFKARHPAVRPAQENSGSLEAARKLTDLGKIPDVIGVADYGVIDKLLVPEHTRWYAAFARNSMVLIYTDESIGAAEINGQNWWQVLQRPGVRAGRSDPALDPNGYRTLMVFQLTEKFYRQPGLAARLERAFPPKYVRPKEADLTALVQAGELDYAWSYASIARITGVRHVTLPREVDLSDPTLGEWYGHAAVRLPGQTRAGRDSVEFRGEPIVYALTIPTAAPNPQTAKAFVRFVLSTDGQAILKSNGFTLLDKPLLAGPGTPPPGVF
jgi:molybdate/tungstate transport system substrate-binding protein